MNSTNEEPSSSKSNNEDILKSLRQLNSCITLTSVKDAPSGSKSPSSSSDSSTDGVSGVSGLSALRGISIQGHTTKGTESLLSNLLGKSKEKEKEKVPTKSDTQANWLNEWSRRCLSISFSSKTSGEEAGEPQSDVRGGHLEDGSPPSSATSASNSRDSFTENSEHAAVPALGDISKSLSVTFLKDKTQQPQQQQSEPLKASQKQEKSEKYPPLPQKKPQTNSPKQTEEEQQQKPQPPQPGKVSEFKCSFCSQIFPLHSDLISHIPVCSKLGCSVSTASSTASRVQSARSHPVARKKTAKPPVNKLFKKLACVHCGINLFRSYRAFEEHHLKHINNKARVLIKRCRTKVPILEASDDSDSSRGSGGASALGASKFGAEERGLKLTFKISSVKKRGRGQKRKTKVQIVSPQDMSDGSEGGVDGDLHTEGGPLSNEGSSGGGGGSGKATPTEDSCVDESMSENSGLDKNIEDENIRERESIDERALERSNSNHFEGFETSEHMNFEASSQNDRPPSTYQPQFESFTGDWFNEYEPGSRIAAAMTGSSAESSGQNEGGTYNANDSGDCSSFNSVENSSRGSPFSNNSNGANKDIPMTQTSERDGLFSQAVLGGEAPHAGDDQRQGSFEQLCLNDSFGHGQQGTNHSQSNIDQSFQQSQQYHNQQGQGGGDLLSELAYLNNTGQQIDATRASPCEGDAPFSSHSSNSGTPTSSTGHPTPPPTDTSFRALATSPLNSPTSPMNTGGPTPPMQSGSTPPIPNSSSPLQQMGQMGGQVGQSQLQQQLTQDAAAPPRLTIANNLMPAATANSGMGQMGSAYGQQWPPAGTSQQNYPNNYMQTASMPGAMAGSLRPVHPNMPMGYRPSPPPRIRGRPPLMGHVGRPPMMRGPGRPPGSSVLPPLMPAPGGTRGGMMPSLQRLPQYGPNQRQNMMGGQKRGQNSSNQSPNKSLRREDINVPARQKDNECQIIAVANRADGMPVISSVQGGSRDERSGTRVAPATTSESTIHLSDSITLSVRSNAGGKEPSRSEKGGDAGVVANLLASRGITVTPAAGEKEGGGNGSGGREERRLPTASDLNLSSAISVHPPTSRDRDGFAVPHPPSAKQSPVNNQVDRPPRPPTVDLTQDVPAGGGQGNRFHCPQCDRTFPTQSLLSDHAKIHQQQTQSRMPFKCHLCTAGFSTQKGQQHHYQQFHQLQLSAGDLAIPVVDFRNPVNIQRMARLGIRSFLPLSNLQNRGAGGVVGIPVLSLENLQNGQMNLQQWGITDVLTLGPPRTMNVPR